MVELDKIKKTARGKLSLEFLLKGLMFLIPSLIVAYISLQYGPIIVMILSLIPTAIGIIYILSSIIALFSPQSF